VEVQGEAVEYREVWGQHFGDPKIPAPAFVVPNIPVVYLVEHSHLDSLSLPDNFPDRETRQARYNSHRVPRDTAM